MEGSTEGVQVVRRRGKSRGVLAWRKGIQSDVDPRLISLFSGWHGPRTILIPRSEQGYGFTLRHFVVYPPESTADKRIKEEDDYIKESQSQVSQIKRAQEPLETIFVKHVFEGGPAHVAGVKVGDRILSVNDITTSGKSYSEVISIIQNCDGLLRLQVLPEHEDILQMAYKGTSQALSPNMYPTPYRPSPGMIPVQSSSALKFRNQSQLRTITPDDTVHTGHAVLRRQWSASSSEENSPDMDARGFSADQGRKLKTSTSYTSGLSIYHDPRGQSASSHRDQGRDFFRERKTEFENRSKENNEAPPNKGCPFGLYYQTPSKENGSKSASDLSSVSVIHRRDKVLHPNDSQENISKALNSRTHATTRVIPLENRYSRERTPSKENISSPSSGYSSSSRHSYPEPIPAQPSQSSITVMPRSYTSQTNVSTERVKSEQRQYIPVMRSTQVTHKTSRSASVDELDTRPRSQSDRNLEIYEHPNQGSGGRTFIVKIGDRHFEGGVSQGHSPSQAQQNSSQQRPSYGTAFALTRSPVSGQYELSPQEAPIVKHKKMMFETGKNDNTQVGSNFNRYKTEIQKITSSGKFNSVQARLANFEKEGSPQKLRRMSSTERYQPPESQGQFQKHMSPVNQQQAYQESAPIRIYVSQGNVNAAPSPIVEIVPVYPDTPQQPTVTTKSVMHVQDEVDGACQSAMHDEVSKRRSIHEGERIEEGHGHNKPVRKPSFLAAVNAPQQRYSSVHSSQEDLLTPDSPPTSNNTSWLGSHTSVTSSISYTPSGLTPTPSSDSIVALTSTPVKDTAPKVVLRRKQEQSPDDDAIKLQRRTSYLMATASDRDTHKLSLDKSLPHNQSEPGTELHMEITPPKQSIKKIKQFFGEKTPRILEAKEGKQDPASPLQEVTKQGVLMVKSDLTDGKKASDRSWKSVWVELRGHALYLSKEKKEPAVTHPFTFDDQPISIKSSIVDIAYDYTKKKHVFRLKTFNGSEYLFQADDQETMMSWIEAIQANNNPDADDVGVIHNELIIRKSSQQEQQLTSQISITALKQSPQVQPKSSKLSVPKAIRIKIPHSPSTKRKKPEKDESTKSKSSLWKFKSFRKGTTNSSGSGAADDNCMFGVPLECCIPSPNNDHVPMIVDLCTKIVEARGLEVTGVYRVPGNTAAVNMMQEELNKGIDNMNVEHEKWCDVNVISSLLKTFFRKLPDPLVTAELYQQFINANRLENPQTRMLKLKRLIHELPEHHFETFKHLAEHLHTVTTYGHINKMDARNLAIVFGPTLIKKKDDDMSAFVRDMSDSCRIIESVIIHHDWFFSSWDRDNEVPIEEGREDEDAPSIPSVSKMSCDDDDAINPRDIVSSIVQAANRKKRSKSSTDKSYEDLDMSVTDGGFRERNIDLEVKRRGMKPHVEITSRSSPNLMAMSGRGSQEQLSLVQSRNSDSSNDRRMTKSQEIIDTDLKYIDQDRVGTTLYAKMRHFSEDSLDRNDEFEISHSGMSNTFSVSQSTIDRLRIIEEEARALREREEKRQRDYERRKLERQKVEQEIQRTQRDIEMEDSHSVEDLLCHSSSDFLNRIGRGESSSEFSNSSSGASSRAAYGSSSSSGDRRKDSSGGKYFVIQSVGSRSNSKNSLAKGSSESLSMQAKRTSSVERLLEVPRQEPKVVAKKRSSSKKSEEGQSVSAGKEGAERSRKPRGNISRSNSMRRGSLDSLIDLIDRNERQRYSYDSTDSEDGSDLLSDLTSTFDQKLKILVNPKYKLNGSMNRLNSQEGNSPSDKENNNNNSSNSYNTGMSAHLNLPPQVPLAHAQVNKYGLCNSNDMLEKQYRDPSLHRSPKDAKIGIAYRFERNPSNSALSQSDSMSGSSEFLNSSVLSSIIVPPTYISTPSNHPKLSIVNNVQSSFGVPSSPSFSSNSSLSAMRADSRPFTKSEKTEVNVSLSKQSKDDRKVKISSTSCDKVRETPRGVEFTIPLPKFDTKRAGEKRERELSPQPTNKRKEKRSKRRHTVGGTQDFDHFKALVSLTSPREAEPTRLSAWEQLRPNVKDTNPSANRSLLSWLQNERLRGSTPDLSSDRDFPSNCF